MFLDVAATRIDVRYRAAVIGLVDVAAAPADPGALRAQAGDLVRQGAQLVEIVGASSAADAAAAVERAVALALAPVACTVGDTASAVAAFEAGAAMLRLLPGATVDVGALHPNAVHLVVTGPAEADLTAAVDAACRAGFPAARIVCDVDVGSLLDERPSGPSAEQILRHLVTGFVARGHLVALSIPPGWDRPQPGAATEPTRFGLVAGAQAVGVGHGARLLRTRRVRSARRVAHTVAAILEAGAA